MFRIDLKYHQEQLANFGGDLDHDADSPNQESGQYKGNELSCGRPDLSESSADPLLLISILNKETCIPESYSSQLLDP